jgi:dipeptidyl aminopeptidase/acylaminoacyl peptidase
MSEKRKVRVGNDGELEYSDTTYIEPPEKRKRGDVRKQTRPLVQLFFLIIGGLFSMALVAFGYTILGIGGGCSILSPCRAVDPIPTPKSVGCSSEILNDPREKIAFLSNRQEQFGEIYLTFIDGSQTCLFQTHAAGISRLVLAPDQQSLWFETSRGWRAVDKNGQNARPLEDASAIPGLSESAQSPDGSASIADKEIGGNRDIYLTDQTGQQTRLTQHPARDTQAAWSPDGSQIVFVSYRDGNNELYTMNSDGSKQRRLTTHLGNDYSPVWFK